MILKELDFDKQVLDDFSFKELQKVGFPNHKNEDYRHINLKDMLDKNLSLVNSDNEISDAYKEFVNDNFYYLVFINQKFSLKSSKIPDEVSFMSSNKDKKETKNPLSLLSESFYDKNDVLCIEKKLNKPLMIVNLSSGEDKLLVNNLHIKIKNDITVDILEIFASKDASSNVISINRDFFVENSKLNYSKLNISSSQDILNINNTISINKGEININTIEKGSKQSINNYDVCLNEELSNINMNGIVKIKDNQNIANTIKLNHNAKNTSSDQNFKQILDDTSKAVFNSQIQINKYCSFSSAHQKSQTILLNDDARMFNEPRMIILTDELEASHGATIGSLSEEAINYMKLRGLSQKKCEKILMGAFLTEVYDHIDNDIIKEYLLA